MGEEYRAEVSDGYEYSQFCHHVQVFSPDSELSMPLEHAAGHAIFIDYAGKPLVLFDPDTDGKVPEELFVATFPGYY